jgi:hypothetical protein
MNFNSDSKIRTLFPRINDICHEIKTEVTTLFDSVIADVEKLWMDKDFENFTKVYAFAEKLFTLGQLLEREGFIKIKNVINSNIQQIYSQAKIDRNVVMTRTPNHNSEL